MSLATNIIKRPGSSFYYARLEVPKEIQPLLGRKDLWKSLKTRDPAEAQEKVLPVLMAWRAQFAELRRRREPTAADLQGAIWQHYEAGIEQDGRERASLPTEQDVTDATVQLAGEIKAGRVPWSSDPLVQLAATIDVQVMAEERPPTSRKRGEPSGSRQFATTLPAVRRQRSNGPPTISSSGTA